MDRPISGYKRDKVMAISKEACMERNNRKPQSRTTEKGRCVIHHEKSDLFVEQFADPQHRQVIFL